MTVFYLGLINLFLTLSLVIGRRPGETIFQNVFRRFEQYMGIWLSLGVVELIGWLIWAIWFMKRPGFTS
ncbi:hypothetical protein D3C81_237640 [compost metagenome]|jgi:hypothetical protein